MADLPAPLVDFVPPLTWFTLQEGTGNLLKTLTTITSTGTTQLPGSATTYNDVYVNAAGLVVIKFPLISKMFAGQEWAVKDTSGLAGTNTITLEPGDAYTIDGFSSFVINSNFGSMSFIWNGTGMSVKL